MGGLSNDGVARGEVGLDRAEMPRMPETERRFLRCCRSSLCLWNSSSSPDAEEPTTSFDWEAPCDRREEAEDELR